MGKHIKTKFSNFINFERLPLPFIQVWQKINDELILINHTELGDQKLGENIRDILGSRARDFFKHQPQIINDFKSCITKKRDLNRDIKCQNNTKKNGIVIEGYYVFIPENSVIATFKRKIHRKYLKSENEKIEDIYFSLINGLDRVGIGIDIVDKNYQILFQNNFLMNRFGNLVKKICYKEYMDLKEPCDFCPMIKSIETNKINSTELLGGDGRNYKLVSIPFPNPDGNIERAIELVIDITERKLSKQKMKTLTMAIEQSTEGVAIVDLKGTLIFANKTFANIHGYTIQEILGKNLSIFHTNKQMTEVNAINKKIKKEGYFTGEVWHLHKNGRVFPTLMQNTLINDENGNPIGILGTLRDITQKKEREQKLKESEEKYRLITENSSDLILILNSNFQIEYVNKLSSAQILGYSKSEMIGRNGKEFIHEDDINEILKRFLKRFELLEGTVEVRLKHKNGTYIWVECKGKLFKNKEGQSKILTIARDITKRKKMEYLIKEEIEKLRNLEKIREEFITRISHELKTPLVSICGATELLMNLYNNKLDSETLEIIKIIESGGKRLKNLVINFLDVSKIDSQDLKIYKQKENITEIIREVIDELNYLAEQRKISVILDISVDFYIDLDRDRIKQVITNLVLNAIKNTLSGGKINIQLKKSKLFAKLKIHDTGVGFTMDERKKIFKKFGKVERHGSGMDVDIEGSGIGLYISKEIIELHNGKIWLKSKGRNKGSTFFIRLPIKNL